MPPINREQKIIYSFLWNLYKKREVLDSENHYSLENHERQNCIDS